MRAVAVAMTNEYCRRGWKPALAFLFAGTAFLTFLARVSGLDNDWDMFHFFWGSTFWCCAMIVFCAQCDPTQAGSYCHFRLPRRLYTLPVSTWAIVGWQMLLGMATSGVTYVVLAGFSNAFLGKQWPVWIPSLVFAVATAVAQAGMWVLVRAPILQITYGCGVWSALLIWANVRRAGIDTIGPDGLWARLSAGEWCTILSLAVVAYVFAVAGVASDRRGELGILKRLIACWHQFTDRFGNRTSVKLTWNGPGRFRSQSSAQFWSERRKMAVGRPSLLLLGLWFVAIFVTMILYHIGVWSQGAVSVALAVAITFAVLGQMTIVAYGTVCAVRAPSDFFATLPTTNVAWARSILKTNAVNAVVTPVFMLSILFVFTPVFSSVLGHDNGLHRFGQFWKHPITLGCWWLLQWTLQGLAWPIKDFARRSRFSTLLCVLGLPPAFILFLSTAQFRLGWISETTVTRSLQCMAVALGVAAFAWTATTFRTAYRRGLVRRSTIQVAVGGWLALCLVLAILCFVEGPPGAAIILWWVGLLSLPTAPLAAVPLSVERARHR